MSVDAVAVLREPVRRAVYEYAAASVDPVGRDEVAAAVGIGRTLAAFHLDKLADAGLLDVTYARRSGRTGPGAGRPAKLYRRSAAEYQVSVPPRDYGGLADALAEAVGQAGAEDAAYAAARERGRSIGARQPGVAPAVLLAGLGYQPQPDGAVVRFGNCPFGAVARAHPPLVCGMNLALVEGLLTGSGCDGDHRARLDPTGSGCCVVVEPAAASAAEAVTAEASKNNTG